MTESARSTTTMNPTELKQRTKKFGLDIIRLVDSLPSNRITDVMTRQLLKCGTSVGANYRSACRARSRADFVSKMGIVEEEADESMYWLEMLQDSGVVNPSRVHDLHQEANELVSIAISSIRTARANKAT